MRKNFFAVLNSDSANVGEMRIYGVIGSYWEENTANDFVRAFSALESTCDRINIHINSPGGSVWEGLPICTAIKSSKKEIHTYVDGIAFSMGAMIAIAAKKGRVHMATGSLLMLHSVSTYIYGNAESLRNEADVLDKYDDVLAGLISVRTSKTVADVKSEYLNHTDHFFTPEEAIAEGLVDYVEDYEVSDVPENVKEMSSGQVAAWYESNNKSEEDSLFNKLFGRLKSAISVSKINNEDMFGNKFSKMGALAKVAAGTLTVESLVEVNEEIVAAGITGCTLVLDSELETITANNTQLAQDKSILEEKVVSQETAISALQSELDALNGKPAAAAGNPATKADEIPAGDGGQEVVDDFETEYDVEAKALFSK